MKTVEYKKAGHESRREAPSRGVRRDGGPGVSPPGKF